MVKSLLTQSWTQSVQSDKFRFFFPDVNFLENCYWTFRRLFQYQKKCLCLANFVCVVGQTKQWVSNRWLVSKTLITLTSIVRAILIPISALNFLPIWRTSMQSYWFRHRQNLSKSISATIATSVKTIWYC